MEYIYSVLAFLLIVYVCYRVVNYMFRAGIKNNQQNQLTPHDLKVLEESAQRLMQDLNTLTSECVAKIEQACAEADKRISQLNPIINQVTPEIPITNSNTSIEEPPNPPQPTISPLTPGEQQLIDGLKSINKQE